MIDFIIYMLPILFVVFIVMLIVKHSSEKDEGKGGEDREIPKKKLDDKLSVISTEEEVKKRLLEFNKETGMILYYLSKYVNSFRMGEPDQNIFDPYMTKVEVLALVEKYAPSPYYPAYEDNEHIYLREMEKHWETTLNLIFESRLRKVKSKYKTNIKNDLSDDFFKSYQKIKIKDNARIVLHIAYKDCYFITPDFFTHSRRTFLVDNPDRYNSVEKPWLRFKHDPEIGRKIITQPYLNSIYSYFYDLCNSFNLLLCPDSLDFREENIKSLSSLEYELIKLYNDSFGVFFGVDRALKSLCYEENIETVYNWNINSENHPSYLWAKQAIISSLDLTDSLRACSCIDQLGNNFNIVDDIDIAFNAFFDMYGRFKNHFTLGQGFSPYVIESIKSQYAIQNEKNIRLSSMLEEFKRENKRIDLDFERLAIDEPYISKEEYLRKAFDLKRAADINLFNMKVMENELGL